MTADTPFSNPHSLRALRRLLGLTQRELGLRLGKPQEEISRLEQRADLRLSTLRAYLAALGGSLELRCRLPDRAALALEVPAVGQGTEAAPPSRAERIVAPHRAALIGLCEHYAVRQLGLFGSAVREDFDPGRSDLDFVVDFERSAALAPAQQYFDFKIRLERLFGRRVDLVELRALPETRLKRLIQRTQVPVYGQAA
jgi:hypothetical protein